MPSRRCRLICPQAQLDNANKIYACLKNARRKAEQITSRGYQLQNSTLVANPVGLSISQWHQLLSIAPQATMIGLVGEIMANSALAQTLTQPSNTPLAGSSAGAIPVTPTSD